MKGFIYKQLELTGANVPPAIIEFKEGLNVICGPTNTGKTFIYQCLDFMHGAQRISKREAPEALKYDKISLTIKSLIDNKTYKLIRSIDGGDFTLSHEGSEEKISAKHNSKKTNNVSAFFLELNNLLGYKIRRHNSGKTENLSYRRIVHFTLIPETSIISESSPIYSSLLSDNTLFENLLKFIVTGRDDSSIIYVDEKEIKTQRKGMIAMLSELINKLKEEIGENKLESVLDEIERHKNRNYSLKKELNSLHLDNIRISNDRADTKNILIEKKNELSVLEERHLRMFILENHYKTDYDRLIATIEATYMLDSGIEVGKCPICSTDVKSDKKDTLYLEKIVHACHIEIEKIEILKEELNKAQNIFDEHLTNCTKEIKRLEELINKYDISLTNDNEIEKLQSQIDATEKKIKQEDEVKSKFESLKSLVDKKLELENEPKSDNNNAIHDSLNSEMLIPLCRQIKSILDNSNYPEMGDISYSEKRADFIINQKLRTLSGKGLRAISYSAFIIALSELLNNKEYRIGVPVLDSPFVTYHKPKYKKEASENLIDTDLVNSFYNYCATKTLCPQIIILENEELPSELIDKVNYIQFSGIEGDGRKGFIP